MSISFFADARDFGRLAREIGRLPPRMREIAGGRALRRVEQMAKTRIVRRSAERIKAPVRKVGERVTTARFADDLEFIVRSDWMNLIDFAPRQTRSGVSVPLRGSYRSAFIATMKSEGVFRRKGKSRWPVEELFGPNPANDIDNHPDVFGDVLEDIIASHLLPRYLHELSRLLPG